MQDQGRYRADLRVEWVNSILGFCIGTYVTALFDVLWCILVGSGSGCWHVSNFQYFLNPEGRYGPHAKTFMDLMQRPSWYQSTMHLIRQCHPIYVDRSSYEGR